MITNAVMLASLSVEEEALNADARVASGSFAHMVAQ
jgi:hypothetical protein